MPRFSDSPYCFLKDFFEALDIYSHRDQIKIGYDWPVMFISIDRSHGYNFHYNDIEIEDSTGMIGEIFYDWFDTEWNINWHFDPNTPRTDGSYLVGPKMNILTTGNGLHELFIKEESGYRHFIVKHLDTKGNVFNFYNHGPNEYNPGDTITLTLSGDYYRFDEYNKTLKWNFNELKNGNEVYFRNDSYYHTWLKEDANNYYKQKWDSDLTIRNYVNYDTLFSYFGNVYKSHDDEHCRIIFNGMKDYTVNTIPEHQRTPKFKKFLEVFFDRHYQENYNLLKNVFTLFDPSEIDIKYLDYLANYYDMLSIPIHLNTNSREFVASLAWLLKRKGTYSEFYIIWKVIGNTINYLNIYEKWHDKNLTGNVPISAYEEYIYVDKPEYDYTPPTDGAGEGWYQQHYPCTIPDYPTTDKILSTHYRIELDINKEPMAESALLEQELWNYLYDYWEYLRPVNRVSSYRILFSPITDFSGNEYSLYPSGYTAFCRSKSSDYILWVQGAFVHSQVKTSSNEWEFAHNQNSKNMIVQVVDENLNEIIPENIEFIDFNNIKITFKTPVTGYALCRKASTHISRIPPIPQEKWNIFHFRHQKENVLQFSDNTEKHYSKSTELLDNDNAEVYIGHNKMTALIGKGDFTFTQNTPSVLWDVTHPLDIKGLVIAVYDNNDMQIYPSNYKILSNDRLQLKFSEPMSGYVVLFSIGNLSFEDILNDFEDSLDQNPAVYRLGEEFGDIEDGNYLEVGNVKSFYSTTEYYYFDIELPISHEYNFKEIALYNNNDEQMFYTKNSSVYKPKGIDFTIHYRVKKEF